MVFLTVSTDIYLCTHNYSAHEHQEVLGTYRANLLKTCNAISRIQSFHPELRLALLLEAFRAGCNEKASGYVTKEDAAPLGTTPESLIKLLAAGQK